MSVAEEVSSEGQSTQAEGVATPDSCITNNTANATEVKCYLRIVIQSVLDNGVRGSPKHQKFIPYWHGWSPEMISLHARFDKDVRYNEDFSGNHLQTQCLYPAFQRLTPSSEVDVMSDVATKHGLDSPGTDCQRNSGQSWAGSHVLSQHRDHWGNSGQTSQLLNMDTSAC